LIGGVFDIDRVAKSDEALTDLDRQLRDGQSGFLDDGGVRRTLSILLTGKFGVRVPGGAHTRTGLYGLVLGIPGLAITGAGYRPEGRVGHERTALQEGSSLWREATFVLSGGSPANDATLREEGGEWTIQSDPGHGSLPRRRGQAGNPRAAHGRFHGVGQILFTSECKLMTTSSRMPTGPTSSPWSPRAHPTCFSSAAPPCSWTTSSSRSMPAGAYASWTTSNDSRATRSARSRSPTGR
jgi:hypothetical protein